MAYTLVGTSHTFTAYNVIADDFADEYETVEIDLIGRGRRIESGTRWGLNGTLVIKIYDQPSDTAATQITTLRALRAEKSVVAMTDSFGNVTNVNLGDIQFSRIPGVGDRPYMQVTINYLEVI